MPKIAKIKLSSCGLKVVDIRKNCDCGIAAAKQHFFKSCGIAIAEVLPSSCGIAIADSKKSCACPPLHITISVLICYQRKIFQTESPLFWYQTSHDIGLFWYWHFLAEPNIGAVWQKFSAKIPTFMFNMQCSMSRAQCSTLTVLSSMFKVKVQGSRFKVQVSRFKFQVARFKVQGSRFKVQGSKFKVQS